MKTKTIYICEICSSEYTTHDEALQCESTGIPEIPDFLENRIWNNIVGVFGPDGISTITLQGFIYSSPRTFLPSHRLVAKIFIHAPNLRNLSILDTENNTLPIDALNPFKGVDFFRYVSKCVYEEVEEWVRWCKNYDLTDQIISTLNDEEFMYLTRAKIRRDFKQYVKEILGNQP